MKEYMAKVMFPVQGGEGNYSTYGIFKSVNHLERNKIEVHFAPYIKPN